jgi:hypothetical protein
MTARTALVLAALLSLAVPYEARAADPKPFPGTPTKWNEFAKHDFKVGELAATVVIPEKPLPGRPWVWRGEFFGAFADCDVALVKAGWHLAYVKVPDLFGSPKAVKHWEECTCPANHVIDVRVKVGGIRVPFGGCHRVRIVCPVAA